jgi:uncharacterized phage protein gp47/JayE
MAYFVPYIDGAGIHLPNYEDIRDKLIQDIRAIYGQDLYLETDSQDYQMISVFALYIYDNQQAALLAYNNSSPSSATGAGLDRIVALNGIQRKIPQKSKASILIQGAAGTVINRGVVEDINGLKWDLPEYVTIPSGGSTTVISLSRDYGAFVLQPGEISLISTPQYGWISAINPTISIPGDVGETEAQLRYKQTLSTSRPSKTVFEATLGDLYNVTGVSRVRGYENPTGYVVNTIPAHSVAFVVEGGTDYDVGKMIFLRKTPGCGTFGTTTITVSDDSGTMDINFFRPSYINPPVIINLKKLTSWSDDFKDSITDAVVSYLNQTRIGEDVYVASLAAPVNQPAANMGVPPYYIQTISVGGQTQLYDVGLFQSVKIDSSDITINAIT